MTHVSPPGKNEEEDGRIAVPKTLRMPSQNPKLRTPRFRGKRGLQKGKGEKEKGMGQNADARKGHVGQGMKGRKDSDGYSESDWYAPW